MPESDDSQRITRVEVKVDSLVSAFRDELHGSGGIRRDTERLFASVDELGDRMTAVESAVASAATSLRSASDELKAIATMNATKAGAEAERAKAAQFRAKVATTVVGGVLIVVVLAAGKVLIAGAAPRPPDPLETKAAVTEALRQLRIKTPAPDPGGGP